MKIYVKIKSDIYSRIVFDLFNLPFSIQIL